MCQLLWCRGLSRNLYSALCAFIHVHVFLWVVVCGGGVWGNFLHYVCLKMADAAECVAAGLLCSEKYACGDIFIYFYDLSSLQGRFACTAVLCGCCVEIIQKRYGDFSGFRYFKI